MLIMRRALLACLCFAATLWTGASAAQDVSVTGVRIGQHGDITRFVLDLSGAVDYHLFTLSEPYRVVVDFPDLKWQIAPDQTPSAKGAIGNFRYGRFRPGTSRVVLDVTGPVEIADSFVLPPKDGFGHRFVVDLKAASENVFQASVEATAPLPSRPEIPIPRMKPPSDSRRIVVLDAGHGGIDPGTQGKSGLREKDIVLKMALELAAMLEATGRYRVVLTRDDDTFLRLRERVATARRAGGELFISIHADAHPLSTTRGTSVYTLSETASDAEAAALAEKENKADVIAGVDLSHENKEVANILIDLAQRETMNWSAIFARLLVEELGQRVTLLRRTHRFAGFAVLKAPDLPSVLVELGYLSNRDEERALNDRAHRARLAAGIVAAIDRYFAELTRLTRS